MQLCSAYTWHDALARMEKPGLARHLERRLAVNGLERCPGCHPERSEGSLRQARQTLRCAQGDTHDLQMSNASRHLLTKANRFLILDTVNVFYMIEILFCLMRVVCALMALPIDLKKRTVS